MSLTAAYSAVQASFWMSFCVEVGFAAVYLRALGYSNAALGAVLAVGNLLGALLGTALSALIDRHERLAAARLTPFVLAAQAASLLLLALTPSGGAVSVLYALYLAFALPVNALNLKLYSDAVYAGAAVDYGFARGMGSLAYVLVSVLLGAWVERASVRVIPLAGLALCALQCAAFLLFLRRAPAAGGGRTAERARGATMAAFLRGNPRFCVLLFGTALLFFAHNVVCNFLINVTRNVGGDTAAMGALNGFMAAMEIPVMLLYSRLFGSRRPAPLLRAAFACFTLKSAAIAAAPNLPLLAAAFLLQAPSFALYTAAIVPYVGEITAHEDSAKAQSLAYAMTTIGAVLASVFGGRLYDAVSAAATLWIACAICAAGSAIALLGVQTKKRPT
ncbi:MAG: MFS transporter [Oscillospiraceae bacterium]|nr:MFS transporter [Oscillospiraceae bacterium]